MCWECRQMPCASGCPNAEEVAVYKRECCGEDIIEGEEYIELEDKYYHKSCMEDEMTGLEIALMIGCAVECAEREY